MKKKLVSAFVCIVVTFSTLAPSFADLGPKPSVSINVNNINNTDCYLDLLSQMPESSKDRLNSNYDESYKELPIYKYDVAGWYATLIRGGASAPLWGNLIPSSTDLGVSSTFSYFGIPKKFKVIIQYKTGELFVSKNIYSHDDYNQTTTLDFIEDMFQYSEENGLKGDVNSDGSVNSFDYVLLRKYILEMISEFPSPSGKIAADVNNDTIIDTTDYSILKRYLLGIISSFPA